MFNDVKNVLLNELNSQKEMILNQKNEIESELNQLTKQLSLLNEQNQLGLKGYEGKQNFSTWERLVSCRKAYREYQAKIAELKSLPRKISILNSEVDIVSKQVSAKLEEEHIFEKIEMADSLLKDVGSAKTLVNLNLSPAKAIDILEENGIQPLLDESDRVIQEQPRNYQGKSDLITVHKTRVMPIDNRLSTVDEAGVTRTESVTIDNREYEYTYPLTRNTKHVVFNGEVSAHDKGDWDDCKYAVLQPFECIPSEKFAGAVTNDAYTQGGIDLTHQAWILCPASDVKQTKQQNPNVHVLGYKGENVNGLATSFLSQLGYHAEEIGTYAVKDAESEKQILNVLKQENINNTSHFNSTDYEDENLRQMISKVISFYKMLRDQNLVCGMDDYARIRPQINDQVRDFLRDLYGAFSGSNSLKAPNPTAIISNGRASEYFINQMQKAGMPMSVQDCQNLKQNFNEKTLDQTLEQIMVNSCINSRHLEVDRQL